MTLMCCEEWKVEDPNAGRRWLLLEGFNFNKKWQYRDWQPYKAPQGEIQKRKDTKC